MVAGILDDQMGRHVLAHKDHLLGFGAELVVAICEAKNVEVVVLNQGEDDVRGGLGQRRFGGYHGVQRPAGCYPLAENQQLLEGTKRAVEESRR